jgi:SSS family solute:Na+ symporter
MTSFHLSGPDYLVVAGYFVIVLSIGFYFRNRLEATRDFFAGGNQIPWWLAGISHYMSSFSAFAFIAYAQMGYTYGWVAVTLFWATIPGCIAGGLFFAKRWRRARVITPIQFLETRFNGFIRQLFAWAGIPMKIFDDALKIFATGLFISVSAGANLYWAIVICGAVMIVYSFLGGLWALVVTDYVQFLMKALAILLLLPLAIHAGGGLSHAFENLPPGFFRISGGPFGWIYIAGFVVLMIISYNASWSLAQKYYSVRNEKEASKAAYFAGFLNLVGAPLMILPAVIGRNLLPDLIAQNRTADVYVLLVLKLLPAGMVGIIMAAMLSATMAMVSSDFNAIASVLTKDVYERLIRPGASEKQQLRVGRLVTLALGLLTTSLSVWIALSQQQSLFNVMVTVLGTFMAPTLLPLLAGLAVRRLTWQGAFAGFALGLANGLVFLALKTWWISGPTYTFDGISLLANAGATILGMIVGTLLSKRKPGDEARVAEFFQAIDTPIQPGEVPERRGNPSGPVLGLSTISVGVLLGAAGILSGSVTAQIIDGAAGVGLIAVGFSLRRRAARDLTLESRSDTQPAHR